MKRRIESLERHVNQVTDLAASWWPFAWLRPEPDERLGFLRVLLLSVLQGLPCGALTATLLVVARPELHAAAPLVAAAFPAATLLVAMAVVQPMWNRRARRYARAR